MKKAILATKVGMTQIFNEPFFRLDRVLLHRLRQKRTMATKQYRLVL